ncbi:bifunctional glutamine-synthetase adenylyltransferase/deadenyltransferase, partial [Dietzia cinnamea P4]
MTGGGIVSRDSSRPRLPSPGRLGLLDDRAADWLDYLGWDDDDAVPVLWALSRAPDPDLALGALVRLRESLVAAGDGAAAGTGSGADALDSALRSDPRLRARLFGLLGSSSALGDHLVAEPTRWTLLRADLPSPQEVAAAMLGAVE